MNKYKRVKSNAQTHFPLLDEKKNNYETIEDKLLIETWSPITNCN